eukprot:scaffold43862_cov80-Phaeocystis_antarctica.AAC.3
MGGCSTAFEATNSMALSSAVSAAGSALPRQSASTARMPRRKACADAITPRGRPTKHRQESARKLLCSGDATATSTNVARSQKNRQQSASQGCVALALPSALRARLLSSHW